LGTGRAQFRHKEERGMIGAPNKLLIYMVPEGGLEPPQGYPYRILSQPKSITSRIPEITTLLIQALLKRAMLRDLSWFLMVRAQFGHSYFSHMIKRHLGWVRLRLLGN